MTGTFTHRGIEGKKKERKKNDTSKIADEFFLFYLVTLFLDYKYFV